MTSDAILRRTTADTPLGPVLVIASERGLRAVRWDDDAEQPAGDSRSAGTSSDGAAGAAAESVLACTIRQLDEYFEGRRLDFEIPLDDVGTAFQRAAWEVLRTIPYGATLTYGQQAARMGDVRRARAVGGANGRNPIPVITPCHRVIGADGSLTGFASGLDRKHWLLDHEAEVLRALGDTVPEAGDRP
jgi:methylated-DNA-[protein]-cysteine S-methyltransferase